MNILLVFSQKMEIDLNLNLEYSYKSNKDSLFFTDKNIKEPLMCIASFKIWYGALNKENFRPIDSVSLTDIRVFSYPGKQSIGIVSSSSKNRDLYKLIEKYTIPNFKKNEKKAFDRLTDSDKERFDVLGLIISRNYIFYINFPHNKKNISTYSPLYEMFKY